MSTYPNALDSLRNPLPQDDMKLLSHAAQHGAANDAIEAIQATLGVLPNGTKVTVAARLDDLAKAIDGITVGTPGRDGVDGQIGATGPQGPQGEKGQKGDVGPQGPLGPKGDTGQRGEGGPPGETLTVDHFVKTAADMDPNPLHQTVFATQDMFEVWVFDVTSNAAVGPNDPSGAPAGYVNMGKIQGPKGEKGDKGDKGDHGLSGLTPPGNGAVIRYDGSTGFWYADYARLQDMGDVHFTGIKDGDALHWDAASMAFVPGASEASLKGLTDVDGSSAFANGDMLKFDSASGKWKPYKMPAPRPFYYLHVTPTTAGFTETSTQSGYYTGSFLRRPSTPAENFPIPTTDRNRTYRVDVFAKFNTFLTGEYKMGMNWADAQWHLQGFAVRTFANDKPIITGSYVAMGNADPMGWFTLIISGTNANTIKLTYMDITWTALN